MMCLPAWQAADMQPQTTLGAQCTAVVSQYLHAACAHQPHMQLQAQLRCAVDQRTSAAKSAQQRSIVRCEPLVLRPQVLSKEAAADTDKGCAAQESARSSV